MEAAHTHTKITVKLYAPLLHAFEAQLARLCLKRDAFLNRILSEETSMLRAELGGLRNSDAARRHIAASLKRMGTKAVNVVVEKQTAQALNKVVDEGNLVRDAFINRLLILMRSSDTLLEQLELPTLIRRSEFDALLEDLPTSPLRAMEALTQDPLYYLREAAHERHQCGLYLLALPSPRFDGFACHLDDAFVPGTKANANSIAEGERLLAELAGLESSEEPRALPVAVKRAPRKAAGSKRQ